MKNTNHWFPFFWNDYVNDTLQLTMLQHGAYLGCLLACYRSGNGLPSDLSSIFRCVGAFTSDEQKAVEFILEKFFKKQDDNSHRHSRVDIELKKITEKSALAVQANAARWEKARENADGHPDGSTPDEFRRSGNGPNQNQNQIQNQNQKKNQTDRQRQDRQTDVRKTENQSVGPVSACLSDKSFRPKASPEQVRWKELTMDEDNDLPDSMRYALPTDEELVQILAQVDDIGVGDFCEAVKEWERMQSPPIESLRLHRWRVWLETCAVKMKEY